MVKVFRKIMLVTAFLIALFIFLAGFYAGFLLDSYRVGDTDLQLNEIESSMESFIIQREFFDSFDIKDCKLLSRRTLDSGSDLAEIGNALSRYDSKSLSHVESYNKLKKKYFLLEINFYVLKKQMYELCPSDFSNIILFFYETKDNQESLNQGYVLDTLVKKMDNLTVLSFDKDFNETALRSLIEYYNITIAPSIVVNFDEKVEGYAPEVVLAEIINKNS